MFNLGLGYKRKINKLPKCKNVVASKLFTYFIHIDDNKMSSWGNHF